MKLLRANNYMFFLLGMVLSLTNSYGQTLTKTKQLEFSVKDGVVIELNSKYTNIEFELTDDNTVTIEAVMDIEGLSQKEVDAYFKKWNFKANKQNNKIFISSILVDKSGSNLDKHGYYQGYFLDNTQLETIKTEMEIFKNVSSSPNRKKEAKPSDPKLKENSGEFNYVAYIEEGNAYLVKWQKENNEPIGKRWFNKTKEERKSMWKSRKNKQPTKETTESLSSKANLIAKVKKSKLPNKNVRSLSKRAIVNKTLKIKIPRYTQLHITVRHGKVIISDEITNLNADLSYVLLQANKISGPNTSIKGAYTNFEVNQWKIGSLDVTFSDFVLIKEATSLNITSNASIVSIDNIAEQITAKGNFKMLSVGLSSNIKHANIDVEDSKQVWVKLPNSPFNISYKGINSKLIHPKKFSLKTTQNNSSKQLLESMPLKNNERFIKIKALSCVMQIYDIPWEDLKIKSLEGL
tara:strand:- start:75217 stop:76605 length:1389 start_codon:yes stop_codon:yes gene_type:complete